MEGPMSKKAKRTTKEGKPQSIVLIKKIVLITN
jgi:hypothetical protein